MNQPSKRTLARKAKFAHFSKANQDRDIQIGCRGHFFGSQIGCRWPVDIGELADRILKAPSSVSNHDRDLVAKMLPRGSVTRRDGSSIRPRMNDPANF